MMGCITQHLIMLCGIWQSCITPTLIMPCWLWQAASVDYVTAHWLCLSALICRIPAEVCWSFSICLISAALWSWKQTVLFRLLCKMRCNDWEILEIAKARAWVFVPLPHTTTAVNEQLWPIVVEMTVKVTSYIPFLPLCNVVLGMEIYLKLLFLSLGWKLSADSLISVRVRLV